MIELAKESQFTFKDHIELLHGKNDAKSWVTLFKKYQKSIRQFHCNTRNIKTTFEEYFIQDQTVDLYISQNTFYKPQRTIENLRYINALYIDLDYYKKDCEFNKSSLETILFCLDIECQDNNIPQPSMIIDSGQGLQLIWLIDRVPSSVVNLWKAIQYYLYDKLKRYGADRSCVGDVTRVLRLVNSTNSKTGREVKLLELNDIRYTLSNLKDEFLPEKPKKEIKKKTNEGKLIHLYNVHTLYKARRLDIETLCNLRNYDMSGCREHTLFLYKYYCYLEFEDEEIANDMTNDLNAKIKYPHIRDTVSAIRYSGKYHYKNDTIIEMLFISEEEQQYMKTLISKELKYKKNNNRRKEKRRNQEGLTERESKKREKLISIYKYMLEGIETKGISEKLGISVRQVQRLRKELEDPEMLKYIAEKVQDILNKDSQEGVATLNGSLRWNVVPGSPLHKEEPMDIQEANSG